MLGIPIPEDKEPAQGPAPVKIWVLVLSNLMVLWSVLIYAYLFTVVPRFGELYAGFGAELPRLTAAVIDYARYTVPLVLIGIVPLVLMWRNRTAGSRTQRRNFMWVIASFGVSTTIAGIAMTGLYLPIFEMGAVVS